MTLPRILYAVPQALETRLEIIKAIDALREPDEAKRLERRKETQKEVSGREIAAEIAHQVFRELRKAGFNPNEPHVLAGNPDGGEWTREGGDTNRTDTRVLSDATPDDNWIPGAQYAANDPPGIGHNQGPPLEDPPTIFSYFDPPKTWEELQQNNGPGYNIHHVVERWSARNGIPRSRILSPENEVPIPKVKHWEINRWLDTQNEEFKDADNNEITPRQYLRGKSWDERRRVGIDALIRFGVLKP